MACGAVVRDRTARLCLTGLLVSGFGTSAMWLTAGVWVKSVTGSDSLAALTVCAMWAPVLAGPALGAVADLVSRRLLLVTVNLVMGGLMASLLLVAPDHRIGVLFAVLFVYGVSGVLLDAAEAALVAGAVDARLRGDFNGLRTTVNEGMKLLAPLAGAGLFARYGAGPVVVLDAVTFAVAALVYARVREPAGPADGRALRGGTAAGIRLVRGSAALRPLVYAGALTMLLAGLNGAAVYAVVEALGRPPAFAGVLYAVQGAGSVAAGLLAGPLLRRMPERAFGGAGIAVFAVAVGARALGGPRGERGDRGRSAVCADRRDDGGAAGDAGRAAGPHGRGGHLTDDGAERGGTGGRRGAGRRGGRAAAAAAGGARGAGHGGPAGVGAGAWRGWRAAAWRGWPVRRPRRPSSYRLEGVRVRRLARLGAGARRHDPRGARGPVQHTCGDRHGESGHGQDRADQGR